MKKLLVAVASVIFSAGVALAAGKPSKEAPGVPNPQVPLRVPPLVVTGSGASDQLPPDQFGSESYEKESGTYNSGVSSGISGNQGAGPDAVNHQ